MVVKCRERVWLKMESFTFVKFNGLSFVIGCTDSFITSLRTGEPVPGEKSGSELGRLAAGELCEYLDGSRRSFDLPLAPVRGEFSGKVRDALLDVPYGSTASYGEIARAVGNPRAARAVGQSVGSNPIWIFVPCHRVIRSDGSPGGYAGGIGMKKILLELERKYKNV